MSDMQYYEGDAQVQRSVEKEIRRRQRLIGIFTILLFLPLIFGVGFLLYGRSDAAMVEKQVNGRVAVVERQIDSRVAPVESQLRDTLPAIGQIRESAAALEGQKQQLASLQKEQATLSNKVSAIPGQLEQVRAVAADASAVKAQLDRLSTDVGQYGKQLVAINQQQSEIRDNQKIAMARVSEALSTLKQHDQLFTTLQ